jgi:hypothetical protein
MATMTLEELVRQLALAHGAGLRCVALYGSTVRGDQVSRQPNLNVMILVDAIDMERHEGEHPRIGAVDVIPLVPLGTTTLDACVVLARGFGLHLAELMAVVLAHPEIDVPDLYLDARLA